MQFFDSKKEFELSITPQEGDKQIYLSSKNAGQFFMLKK